MKILLIEDEKKIAEFVCDGLQRAGFEVAMAKSGEEGFKLLISHVYDALLLDVMLPAMSGLDVLEKIREINIAIPVIILSAKSDIQDKLNGFHLGANDYLPKPFYMEELIARIKIHTQTNNTEPERVQAIGPLQLDLISRKASWHAISTVLSQREFALLEYLMRSPGHIYTRKQILQHVWDIHFDPNTNVVEVCIQRIKSKLMRHAPAKSLAPIETIRGVGYRIRLPE
jgi:DNA-binding response OmpR family regulator